MVQNWTRGSVPRLPSYPQSRQLVESFDQRRPYDFLESARHQPPMAIDTALRTHCGIWAKQYFVAVILDDGTPTTFFSPGQKLQDHIVRQFFDSNKFQQAVTHSDSAPSQPLDGSTTNVKGLAQTRPAYNHRYSASDRHQLPGADDADVDEMGHRFGRKRQRSEYPYDDDNDSSAPILARRGIRVCDHNALWKFYDQRFKSCQQSACKLIAKAWVKAVEPKKQSTHPYTGSDEKAPDWWPKPWGTSKEEKVRHKEPDHLYKRERVFLLSHILSLVVKPVSKQHVDIQKLGLNVQKLMECTYEALSGFFSESATNASKKKFLDEIFKVAKQQERYYNGEIDATAEVYVLNENQVWDQQTSENDDASYSREDDDQQVSPSSRSNGTQSFISTPTVSQSSATSSHTGSFLHELPVRNSQHTNNSQPLLQDIPSQHNSTMLEEGLSVNGAAATGNSNSTTLDLLSSTHESSRRPSAFGDYSNGNSGLFSTGWQSGTSAPSAHTLYAHQQSQPSPSFVSNVQATHAQPFAPSAFIDPMPRPNYNSSHSHLFRAGEIPPPPPLLAQQHTYSYNDGRSMPSLPGVSDVLESVPRGHM